MLRLEGEGSDSYWLSETEDGRHPAPESVEAQRAVRVLRRRSGQARALRRLPLRRLAARGRRSTPARRPPQRHRTGAARQDSPNRVPQRRNNPGEHGEGQPNARSMVAGSGHTAHRRRMARRNPGVRRAAAPPNDMAMARSGRDCGVRGPAGIGDAVGGADRKSGREQESPAPGREGRRGLKWGRLPPCSSSTDPAPESPEPRSRAQTGAHPRLRPFMHVRARLIGLERDLQAALRYSIEQLEPGLGFIAQGVYPIEPVATRMLCNDHRGAE